MSNIQTYAIIEDSVVTNTVLWDGDITAWQPPAGSTANLLPSGSPVGVGYTFDGTLYTAPPLPTHD